MIKIAICDDEPLAIENLSDLINCYANKHNLKVQLECYFSGEQFLDNINKNLNPPDIAFLDIKMQQINGIEAAKIIRKTNEKMIIVFVSSLAEYVFDAFDVDAKAFIVKPVERNKLYEILAKAISILEKNSTDKLTLHCNGKIEKIPFNQIHYCEVADHSVFVYEKEKINKYQGKIDDLEKELNNNFFRCHRSYIVNLQFVDSYKENIIYMPSGEKIPVAGRRKKEFIKSLLHFQRNEVR